MESERSRVREWISNLSDDELAWLVRAAQIEHEQRAESRATAHDDEGDEECPGHESLRGDSMGATVFCDGSCVKR